MLYSFVLVIPYELIDRRTINVTAHLQYIDAYKPGQFAFAHVIDGIHNSTAGLCSCCGSVTEGGWVQLDLQRLHFLDHIVIKGRSDRKCCCCIIVVADDSLCCVCRWVFVPNVRL